MKTKPTEVATNPAQRARAEVDRLNEQERELSKLSRVKVAELSAARAKRGDDVLAASAPSAAASESSRAIAVMGEELAALADAATAARRQRMSAIPGVFKAEADELERQATQLETDATANEAAVRDALKAVAVLADWEFVPRPPQTPDRAIGPGQQGSGAIVVVDARGPKYQRFRVQAQGLRVEAGQRRHQPPHSAGMVEVEGLEQLVDVVFSEAMRIGPSVDEISGWYEQAVAKERRRRQQLELDDLPINVLHLQWVRGQIDVSASFVRSASPSAPREQAIDTDADFAAAAANEQSA